MRENLINRTIKSLSKLPNDKVREVSDFTEYILKKHEEETLQNGIEKLVSGIQYSFRFHFTDLKGNKNRPALVLINSELDITLAFISTQLKWNEETDIPLKPTKNNGLKKESLLRLSKLATIDKNLVLGRIGRIELNDLMQVNSNLIKLFKLE